VSERARTSTPEGSGPGDHFSVETLSELSDNITDIRSVAATPSTMQW
jgi:hypothetical protein